MRDSNVIGVYRSGLPTAVAGRVLGWGLLLPFVWWSLTNPGGRPCGRNPPPILAGDCSWLWWACSSQILAEGPVGALSANPSRVLWCACVSGGSPLTPRILAGVGRVCVCALVPLLRRQSRLGFEVCVLGACFAFTPPFPAGVRGVCFFALVVRLPRRGCGSLSPAKFGWGLWCVCLSAGFVCALEAPAGVCDLCVCAPVFRVPRQSWPEFVVCVFVCSSYL